MYAEAALERTLIRWPHKRTIWLAIIAHFALQLSLGLVFFGASCISGVLETVIQCSSYSSRSQYINLAAGSHRLFSDDDYKSVHSRSERHRMVFEQTTSDLYHDSVNLMFQLVVIIISKHPYIWHWQCRISRPKEAKACVCKNHNKKISRRYSLMT